MAGSVSNRTGIENRQAFTERELNRIQRYTSAVTATAAMTRTARKILIPVGFYTATKYSIYLLLAINIFIFLREEWQAAQHTYFGEISLDVVIEAFTQTIDTAAWVALLLLFELETFVLPNSVIRGRWRWVLHGFRAICYLFIVYAFYGYVLQCMYLYEVVPFQTQDLCALVSADSSMLTGLNEYVRLDANNCAELARNAPLWQLAGQALLISDQAALDNARILSWLDVVNAGNWLLIVLLLEIDVRLQIKGRFKGRVLKFSEGVKVFLYGLLLVCAICWGYAGTFLDFWDAFLWLLAFGLIEMNLLERGEERTVKRIS